MKLQSLGILNTVASLGGAWTKNQFELLRRFNATLCFIPDSDIPKGNEKLGAGFKNVIKNGTMAIQCGFTVSVREIPNETGKKLDPDSYITDQVKFSTLNEEEFLVWYARKEWDDEATTEDRLALINKICDLIVLIKDETTQTAYISKLIGTYQHKAEWNLALKAAKRRGSKN